MCMFGVFFLSICAKSTSLRNWKKEKSFFRASLISILTIFLWWGGFWRAWEMGNGVILTWTQRAIISANRDNDLGGYSPRKAGSTILPNASMSWSCGVAHCARHCSDFGFELKTRKGYNTSDVRIAEICLVNERISRFPPFLSFFRKRERLRQQCYIPVKRHPPCQ